jgi:hypothetical protein
MSRDAWGSMINIEPRSPTPDRNRNKADLETFVPQGNRGFKAQGWCRVEAMKLKKPGKAVLRINQKAAGQRKSRLGFG